MELFIAVFRGPNKELSPSRNSRPRETGPTSHSAPPLLSFGVVLELRVFCLFCGPWPGSCIGCRGVVGPLPRANISRSACRLGLILIMTKKNSKKRILFDLPPLSQRCVTKKSPSPPLTVHLTNADLSLFASRPAGSLLILTIIIPQQDEPPATPLCPASSFGARGAVGVCVSTGSPDWSERSNEQRQRAIGRQCKCRTAR
ncbi:hypothetical protein EV126DRAFT_226970 [Verticillium dahliae]|nr:hypothetical protein EV126DRAFT_226970 [Verticillium dahliae]